MNTELKKIKADLLAFGKKNGACVGQYQRLYKAESIEEVIAVVKDNFWWCARHRDFADVIMANREQFAEHQIWANQDVKIQEGIGYLLATEGKINAKSWDTATIHAESYGSSTINAESYGFSTIHAKSCGSSTIHATSWDTSTIHAVSWDASTINAESYGLSTMIIRTSTIECKVKDKSIARYVYANRIVVADKSLSIETEQ